MNLLLLRKVFGTSMEPTLRPGQFVWARKFADVSIGDVVIFEDKGKDIVKRIYEHNVDDSFNLRGDNIDHTSVYKHIEKSQIKGKVIFPIRLHKIM